MTLSVPPPVTEADLLAYVDDRLAPGRRAEIETHLLRCPQDAARVAADLALLEGLRMLFDRPAAAPRPRRRARLMPEWGMRALWAAALAAGGFLAGLGASAAGLPLFPGG